MIKLNNKNITYVALADSNNSVKAPKEIWYADSNNSVKLVYRRKDALIEGEDYEKYHWLEGDGSAYIDTLITDLSISDYIKTIFDDSDNIGVSERTWGREGSRLVVGNDNSSTSLKVWGTSSSVVYNNDGIYIYDMYFDLLNDKVTVNNQIFTLLLPNDNGLSFLLFARHFNTSPSRVDFINWTKYKSFEIHNQLNLIPCKLLKPVPKWLDANGIRRQVGECGMIDLVSGKFYGNVNSVGTFTVENYYERKEWLVAQTTEKVTMMVLPLRTSDFKYSLHLLDSVPNLSYFTSGWHTYGVTDTQTLVFIYDRKNSTRVYSCQTGFQLGDIIMIDSTAEDLLFNNISIPKYGFPAENFIIQTNNNVALNMRVSSITIDGKERYIPCTLTMDLPASMDANNIARTKGTSGMWDLVSDKFYGNVANSGTFKAVNLAEGVDYEVHQWLKGDGTAYIQGLTYNMWSNHLQTKIGKAANKNLGYYDSASKSQLQIGYDNSVLVPYLLVIFRNKENKNHIADIRPFTDMPNVVNFDFYIENSTFYCNRDGIIYTNQDTTDLAIESNWTSIQPKIYASKMAYIREVLPNDTYRSNLTPVKLLKSIPSTYDANGIARQAGECGMYDTVNDVFYGNVASSGSFTVSDD